MWRERTKKEAEKPDEVVQAKKEEKKTKKKNKTKRKKKNKKDMDGKMMLKNHNMKGRLGQLTVRAVKSSYHHEKEES